MGKFDREYAVRQAESILQLCSDKQNKYNKEDKFKIRNCNSSNFLEDDIEMYEKNKIYYSKYNKRRITI